jgi:hypothetical protein
VTTESDDGSKRGAVYVSVVLKAVQETNVCKQSALLIGSRERIHLGTHSIGTKLNGDLRVRNDMSVFMI